MTMWSIRWKAFEHVQLSGNTVLAWLTKDGVCLQKLINDVEICVKPDKKAK